MSFDFPTNPPPGTPATTPDGAVRYWDGQKWDAAYSGGGPPGARDASNDLSTAQNATIARTLANRFADRYSVEDWLTPGQPDGTTDNSAQLQAAIDAAAGVVVTGGVSDRVGSPGNSVLLFPANPNPYVIGTTLFVPSHSHIVIEARATLRIANGAAADCLHITTGAANVVIEQYGMLDGNASNAIAPSGGITSSGACSNILVQGGNLGLTTNFVNWPVNISCCTNGEVRGIGMTNSGNSPSFSGVTSRIAVAATGSSYVSATGVLTLSTAPALHGISVGQTFYYWASTGIASGLQGEYVAIAGTTPTVLVAQAAPLITGDLTITPPGNVGTCVRSYNVGFVDCYVRNIRDLGLCLYSGCNGSYIRNCDVDNGPVIFADAGQPAPCVDCEISGCYSHDAGSGPAVVSNQALMYHHNSKVFGNTVANQARGGIALGYSDSTEVYDNVLHDNMPQLEGSTGQSGQIVVTNGAIRANVHDNTIRNSGQSSTAQSVIQLAAPFATYAAGVVSLTTASAHGIAVGARFYVANMFGSGNYLALNGMQIATAGTAGTTLNFAAAGLGTFTITSGAVVAFVFAVSSTIVAGTYDPGTGNTVLTTAPAHGLAPGQMFVLSGMTGTGNFSSLDGLQIATAGTAGTTLNFTEASGLVLTITGGTVLPANFGIALDAPPYCRIAGNRIGDYQATRMLTAPLGGTCGNHNLTEGNHYGPYLATGGLFPADACVYAQSSVQGISYDMQLGTTSGRTAAQNVAGATTFPTQGLTSAWNYHSGRGEIDFFCGRGIGAPGGFEFFQVSNVGVIDTTVGIGGSLLANDGLGNVRLAGALVHGAMQTATLTAGGTITIPDNTSYALIRNSASIATGTVALPSIPGPTGSYQLAGSELEINFQNPVGTLTLTGVIEGPVPTGITTAHTSLAFVWGGSSWVRRIMA